MLAALKKANLKIKTSKYRFKETELVALDHLIGAQGIRPDPEKVQAIQDILKPAEGAPRAEIL